MKLFTLLLLCCSLFAGTVDVAKDPTPAEIQNIIKKFTDKETEFAHARELYTYRQTSKMTETSPAGGTYQIVEEVSFDNRNRRTSHVTYAPVNGLEHIQMTGEDEQDLRNVMPFVMTNETASEYNVTYKGREKVDEITCYRFTVAPKVLTKDRKRYFEGDIWVDDQDLQIVKTFGKSTGALHRGEDQQFPKFETYREQIDGKYWFPTYTYADDTLNFKDSSQRIKVVVKYDHYKKFEFKTDSSIQYGGVEGDQPSQSRSHSMFPRLLIVALLALQAFAAGAPRPVVHVNNFGAVNDHLLRGAEPSAVGISELGQAGVKVLIDLRETGRATEFEKQQAEKLGIKYTNIPFPPLSAPSPAQVQMVLNLIAQNQSQTVFVHCRRGKDRTGTVIACYRIQHDGWDNQRALSEARSFGMSPTEIGMRSFILHFSPSLNSADSVRLGR